MKNKLLLLTIISVITHTTSSMVYADVPNEADIVVCQDQAENYGNGKGDDVVAKECLDSFKKLADKKAIAVNNALKIKFFGYKNMIIVEKIKNNIIYNEIIAGNSTELKSVIAVVADEKNQEIIVLEESGDVLFFTTTLTGNIAPYRILKHKALLGASEIEIDNLNDQVIISNKKSDKIYFFSRLANFNAPKEKQNLKILKVLDTSSMDFSELSLDVEKHEIHGVDKILNQKIVFPLK